MLSFGSVKQSVIIINYAIFLNLGLVKLIRLFDKKVDIYHKNHKNTETQ